MEKFLQSVAKDLKDRIGNDLSRTVMVFPNKRAALFFNKYLVKDETSPIWSPRYLTISELFTEANPEVTLPDTIELVCRLHKSYTAVIEEKNKNGDTQNQIIPESLDYFYQWGETLLSDFDDIDKNLIDTKSLFKQINDWNKLEDTSFIDEEMEERIRKFFSSFSVGKMTTLKERFLDMWDNLNDIYTRFNEDLANEKLAYEGALYRTTAEQGLIDKLCYDKFVFVGFNVIDEVEKKVFRQLNEKGKALFYWDYDDSWGNYDAVKFVKGNIDEFPNALPQHEADEGVNTEISIVSSKTNNLEAQYAREWIAENITADESDTALVLCDEKQLQQVMHCIPDNVRALNVTMGYPLGDTPVMGFVTCLTELQESYDPAAKNFSYKSVCKLLRHPYSTLLSPSASAILDNIIRQNLFYPKDEQLYMVNGEADTNLQIVFTPQLDNLSFCNYLSEILTIIARNSNQSQQPDNEAQSDDEALDESALFAQLYNESLFQAYTTVTRFANLIENKTLDVSRQTIIKLIERVMQGINIPFHGEPAIGLQVMGMLETRNLDFDRIIMLGVNEGMLPQNDDKPSFIPGILRRAYGMTTPDRRVAVFAYYFFRLLRRCSRLCLIYNDEVENGKKNEMSRFLLQIIASSENVSSYALVPQLKINSATPIAIKRDALTLAKLRQRFGINPADKTDEEIAGWLRKWSANPDATVGIFREHDRSRKNRKILSPSAINTYLDCTLMFYFKYIAHIRPNDEMSSDIDSAVFGTIFHASAEEIYSRLAKDGNLLNVSQLDKAIDTMPLDGIIDFYFRKFLFKQTEISAVGSYEEMLSRHINCPDIAYNGIQIINRAVISKLLIKLLDIDKRLGDFHYLSSEVNVSRQHKLKLNDGSDITISIGGNIDRLDYVNGTIRVVDYKTGASEARARDFESIFQAGKEHSGYHLQTLLYSSIVSDMTAGKVAVAPLLLYIQKQKRDEVPTFKIGRDEINDINGMKNDIDDNINRLVDDIFNGTDDFTQTDDINKCQFCDFKALCNR